jgi:hypothetical protein
VLARHIDRADHYSRQLNILLSGLNSTTNRTSLLCMHATYARIYWESYTCSDFVHVNYILLVTPPVVSELPRGYISKVT